MKLALISGLSGSGKSIALHTLEDMGYHCVDNLPLPMLKNFTVLCKQQDAQKIAVGIDIRSLTKASDLIKQIEWCTRENLDVHLLFLEASDRILIQRFSETRRIHPFSQHQKTIEKSITYERNLLANIKDYAHKIDTSLLSSHVLQKLIAEWIEKNTRALTLLFESFGFKYGLPLDADFVFDVRCLPSPHYIKKLKPYCGLDNPVIDYFSQQGIAQDMIKDIADYIRKYLQSFMDSNRSYLNIAIGCTGGRHRSVYTVEALAKKFSDYAPLVRHRQLFF